MVGSQDMGNEEIMLQAVPTGLYQKRNRCFLGVFETLQAICGIPSIPVLQESFLMLFKQDKNVRDSRPRKQPVEKAVRVDFRQDFQDTGGLECGVVRRCLVEVNMYRVVFGTCQTQCFCGDFFATTFVGIREMNQRMTNCSRSAEDLTRMLEIRNEG